MMRRSVLIGTGSALPERIVTNAELTERVDTSDAWIVERTGIRARHIVGEGKRLPPWRSRRRGRRLRRRGLIRSQSA